ncbi:MAG TPA: DUF6125 family protein [Smithellaceae bacterium]|jgi:hypothetical protein|nr:hypothetical protein [Deltaproteobacteria bacterium]HNV64922.1 DUF6125 family protein [Smithellaceae bacterium]HOF77106.1 DUF6125 family protein [Smithellaceae bacterium]HOS08219.1 DUF6125 family protein [Smithellaceae bacterium]HOU03987.1 DUF6125 family protein [Smithellaceae bacterium]
MVTKKPDRNAELMRLTKKKLIEYIDVLSQNFWTVQNNWMANVNNRYGSEVAAVMDELLWAKWPAVEAYRFKKLFNLGNGLDDVVKVMTLSLGAEKGPEAEYSWPDKNHLIFKVTKCPMQLKRRENGWDELNCKPAFTAMWKAVAGVINPDIRVVKVYAPHDPHPDNDWCGAVLEL